MKKITTYFLGLQGLELIRPVYFLDRVRVLTLASFQLTKQTPQALGVIPVADDVSRRCLHKLRAICNHKWIWV